MAHFDDDDIERFFRYLARYLNSYGSENTMKEISSQLRKYFADVPSESGENFDRKASKLIMTVEKSYRAYSVIILKNENDLFDIFAFGNKLDFALVNLVSSEAFLDNLRRNPLDGYVIDNVSSDDVLIFLKAYYLHRKDPSLSQTSLNPVLEYNNYSLEMASIDEKFNEDDLGRKVPLQYIFLYDKAALPYSLSYLDEYKKTLFDNKGNCMLDFFSLIKRVRQDRFIGMKLQKIK